MGQLVAGPSFARAYIAPTVRQSPASDSLDTVEALVIDLLEWIGPTPRPYAEVLEAWRTSCPRLPVWEDATERGFIARHHVPGGGALVSVSAAGAEHLRKHRRPSQR
jgi:D-3-phosphoglycerate dehydrogenase